MELLDRRTHAFQFPVPRAGGEDSGTPVFNMFSMYQLIQLLLQPWEAGRTDVLQMVKLSLPCHFSRGQTASPRQRWNVSPSGYFTSKYFPSDPSQTKSPDLGGRSNTNRKSKQKGLEGKDKELHFKLMAELITDAKKRKTWDAHSTERSHNQRCRFIVMAETLRGGEGKGEDGGGFKLTLEVTIYVQRKTNPEISPYSMNGKESCRLNPK